MQKADHSGHRDRLRAKYAEHGVEALAPHEVIEMLLYNAIPYRNTNDIAKNLLDRFGSLSAVMDASLQMLTDAGLTRNQALFLKLIPDVSRLYMRDKHENPGKVIDTDLLGDYIRNRFIGLMEEEHVFLLLVDIKMKEVFSGVISDGAFGCSLIPTRRILTLALNYGAAGAVIAHNHPSGLALPSREDCKATQSIRKSLQGIGVELLDHYIVADDECVSFRLSGLMERLAE